MILKVLKQLADLKKKKTQKLHTLLKKVSFEGEH